MSKIVYLKILAVFLLFAACTSPSNSIVDIIVLETSDMHGEFGLGTERLYGYLTQQREENGDKLLLLDCGDFLQGSPDVFFANSIDTESIHIYQRFFNELSYDAVAVGNHDFEAGPKIYDRVFDGMDAQVLCANILKKSTKRPAFKPYRIFNIEGYKIAVLGLVSTTDIRWFPSNSENGIIFDNIEKAASEWVPRIRNREKPDLLIGLFHTGMGDTLAIYDNNGKDISNANYERQNSAAMIAYNVPGIDLICCGHDHVERIDSIINRAGEKVYIMSPGPKLKSLTKANISIVQTGDANITITIKPSIIRTDSLSSSSAYRNSFSEFLTMSAQFNNQKVCDIDTTICSRDAQSEPSAWLGLLHKDILDYCNRPENSWLNVSLSVISSYSTNDVWNKGPLKVEDFINYFPHEDKLSVVELTGTELETYIEYIYHLRFNNPDLPIYNFDTFYGLDFAVDMSKPFGQRVIPPKTYNGKVYSGVARLHIAMNSFRAMGGGGLLQRALKWDAKTLRERRLWESKNGIREMMIKKHYGDTAFHPVIGDKWLRLLNNPL